jgi:hypothetical protein
MSIACDGSCAASTAIPREWPGLPVTPPASSPPGRSRWKPNGPRSLARASRQLARSAELRASHRIRPPRSRARGSTLALFLLAGSRPESTAAWLLLARQLSLLGRDIAQMHRLRGELDRAHELETEFAGQLHDLHEDLKSRFSRPPADPEVAAALGPVLKPLPPRPSRC